MALWWLARRWKKPASPLSYSKRPHACSSWPGNTARSSGRQTPRRCRSRPASIIPRRSSRCGPIFCANSDYNEVLLRLWEPAHIIRIDQVGHSPTLQIILCHAGMDEVFHALSQPGGVCDVERNEAVFFGGPGIVDLVEFVPGAEFCADGVPQQLHELNALFRVVATRATDVLIKIGAQRRIV